MLLIKPNFFPINVIFCLLLTIFLYGCPGASPLPSSPTPSFFDLSLDKTSVAVTHTKGVDDCPQVVGTITAKNVGTKSGTLIASDTGTSFSVSAGQALLAPGESTTITIRFTCNPPASATAWSDIILVDFAGNTIGFRTIKATVTVV